MTAIVRSRIGLAVGLMIWLASSGVCQASQILLYSASKSGTNAEGGNNVSGTISFSYNTSDVHTLIIGLQNTTSGGTTDSADVLVGFTFSLSGIPTPTFTTGFLTPDTTGATLLGSGSFTDSWKTPYDVNGNSNVTGSYGASTNGFGGAFNGEGLNNQDNGIVATGTDLESDGLSNKIPLAMDHLSISLTDADSDFSKVTSFSNINLLFGTKGTGVLRPSGGSVGILDVASPEPATLATAILGVALVGLTRLRRRRRS